jgi:ribonuclease-3
MLFHRFPEVNEGDLTRLRAALVRTDSLAQLAVDCRVGEALRIGKGEEQGGGRARINNLCGAFEALVGALYLDQDMNVVRDFLTPRLETRLSQVLQEQSDRDARSLLQERSQADYSQTPQYRTVSMTGPDHERVFTVEVLIGENVMGTGIGRSKQSASQAAAQDALQRLASSAAGL